MTQNFGKASSEYVTRFEEQCSAANQSTDDPTALAAFIEGIEDDQIHIQMESRTYETFEELQVNLRKSEDVVKKRKNREALAIGEGDRPVKRLSIAAIEGEEEGSPLNRNATQASPGPWRPPPPPQGSLPQQAFQPKGAVGNSVPLPPPMVTDRPAIQALPPLGMAPAAEATPEQKH
uniref:Retrotransposon gag domain-containing protein n=1 Tax=Chromera velia CCMP2878 TaxID=1169474 RepID=A0A0G4FD39_9ALVE|eukprot:Cvel_3181.t1-p1 / transcript=Cvel_3181.t1 / gene=Cvel_3181 / organism=Chromera_velia_CCMP2878 / gene_product=hypothetical protein / transcript_product=hypothetical protein / location=Cvel_scaffold124:31364-32347(-) / protein_length=176 / sequence_SO=supercontig / SO=protein_coding / is_pseudo=false